MYIQLAAQGKAKNTMTKERKEKKAKKDMKREKEKEKEEAGKAKVSSGGGIGSTKNVQSTYKARTKQDYLCYHCTSSHIIYNTNLAPPCTTLNHLKPPYTTLHLTQLHSSIAEKPSQHDKGRTQGEIHQARPRQDCREGPQEDA
jgi:hypothetical protein